MKKQISVYILGLIVLVGVGVLTYVFLGKVDEKQVVYQETKSVEQVEEESDELIEAIEEEFPLLDDLYDELEVSDIDLRFESIANSPNLWRSFIESDLPLADPTFQFGCLDYLDTGARLILDVFIGEDGETWVAEAKENELLGVGRIDPLVADEIFDYHLLDEEIACLVVSHREYSDYTLFSEGLSLEDEFDSFRPMVSGVILPLPDEIEDALANAYDAILIGDNIVFAGYDGVEVFDTKLWERIYLYSFIWKDVWGLSKFVPAGDDIHFAFAIQEWDQELANIFVYKIEDHAAGYSQYFRNGLLAWETGVSGISGLEFEQDLSFIDTSTLQVIEYPEFDYQIIDGKYPPDPGKKEVTEWVFSE